MSGNRQKDIHEIHPEDLFRRLHAGDLLLVDVREPGEHARERIPGAALTPLSRLDPGQLPDTGGRTLVLHCESGSRSQKAAARLLAGGVDEVAHLPGGITAWKAAGLPIARDAGAPISLERQVRIAAGILILLGLALGLVWTPWALILSAFVGAGQIFAGVTNTCGMGMMLARLPYNQRRPA